MAEFQLGFLDMSGVEPKLTFIGAADLNGFDPRGGTVWSILGPSVTFQGASGPETVNETYWYAYGTGFDVDPNAPLPTSGTITSLYHVVPLDDTPPPASPDDLFVDRVFATITGLNIAAADFAAAVVAGTVADLLLSGDDLFRGSSTVIPNFLTPVFLMAGAGNDTVFGSGGTDWILGGSGDDLILSRDGASSPAALAGATLEGGSGDDTVRGGDYFDLVVGGDGVDRLWGGKGNDTLSPGAGRDRVLAGDGDDLVVAAAGEMRPGEVLDGGLGTDLLALFAEANQVSDVSDMLVSGFETWQLNGRARMTIQQLQGIGQLEFGGLITLTLAESGFVDLPQTGAWLTFSPLARLTLQAGAGRDIINGRDLADVGTAPPGYFAYGAGDIIHAGDGADVVNGGSGNDSLRGQAGNDALNGEGGQDVLNGEGGSDTLSGGAGGDLVFGGAGADTLTGGAGGDVFAFFAFAESSAAAADQIQDFTRGQDVIDVAAVSAATFIFNGTGGFLAGGTASVFYQVQAGKTLIQFDDGGGGEAEMAIRLNGVYTLSAFDFVL